MKWPKAFFRRWPLASSPTRAEVDAQRQALIQKLPAPTFWMLGKSGSGKSSIVQLLTGADRIQIGHGFRPTTEQTDLYTFPDRDLPVMRFLDTRGLGEAHYDPQRDLAELQEQADAMIVTHRLLDFAGEIMTQSLRALRRAAPQRPVLLTVTCLHEAYPQQQHPPYPFAEGLQSPAVLPEVARALEAQQRAFAGLYDALIPVDITRPEEGFEPADYGGEHFTQTLHQLLPASCQFALRRMPEVLDNLKDLHERAAMPYIHGAASLAATAALSPLPWVDLPVVAAIQTRMVYAIARVYHQPDSVHTLMGMLTAAGIGFAARMGVRELLKLIPYVGTIAGGVLGAAMAYSYTYAMGRVCCWYQSSILSGHQPTRTEIAEVFQSHWNKGHEIWKAMRHPRD